MNFSDFIVLEDDYLRWTELKINSIFKSINDRAVIVNAVKQYKPGYHNFLFYEINANEGRKKLRTYDIDLDSVKSNFLLLNEK